VACSLQFLAAAVGDDVRFVIKVFDVYTGARTSKLAMHHALVRCISHGGVFVRWCAARCIGSRLRVA
jgi:hypothetical protein